MAFSLKQKTKAFMIESYFQNGQKQFEMNSGENFPTTSSTRPILQYNTTTKDMISGNLVSTKKRGKWGVETENSKKY